MSTLATLQRAMQSSILTGDRTVRVHVVGTRQVSVGTRLNIYREAYYLRLAEALATTYSSLRAFLGEDQFRWLARLYIDAHPSRHYSVRYFGHRLAAFLSKQEPYRSNPVLIDLARWEWAVADVFDARDSTSVTADVLQGVPANCWPALRLGFHDAIRLVSSRWNVAEIWSALNREQIPPEPILSARRGRWAIWRSGLDVYFAPMDAREERALRAALRGDPFAHICAVAPAAADEMGPARWAAGILRQWLDRGWIVRLEGMRVADPSAPA